MTPRAPVRGLGDETPAMSAIDPPRAAADPELQATLSQVDPRAAAMTGRAARTPARNGSRYRRIRPHARGGLGQVFVAEDTELHREVAVKEIQPERADDMTSRTRFIL